MVLISDTALSSDKGCMRPFLHQNISRTSCLSVPLCQEILGGTCCGVLHILGSFTSNKNERLCDSAPVGSCGICFVSGLSLQSDSLLSCQPGLGVAVYFVLFHVFCFPGSDFPAGISPSWPAFLSYLEPPEQIFYSHLITPSNHPVALQWLGTHFQNGMENQQIGYTINRLETCLWKQHIRATQCLLLASAWFPPGHAHPTKPFQYCFAVLPTPDGWRSSPILLMWLKLRDLKVCVFFLSLQNYMFCLFIYWHLDHK